MSRTFRNVDPSFVAKKHTITDFNKLLFKFSRDCSTNKRQVLPLKEKYDRIEANKLLNWELNLFNCV